MEIIFKDLVAKYNWEEIEPVLSLLYPSPKRSIFEYKEAYQKFAATVPTKTGMRIVIEENINSSFEKWHEVYGKNGTLVKELFQSEYAHKHLVDTWESEQGYALGYTSWAEIAGMAIDSNILATYAEKDIVAHVLTWITEQWRTDEQDLKVLTELEVIANGQEQNVIKKELFSNRGHLQIWSEKENGEFHGLYTVYWDNGINIMQQGIIVDGNKEGIWTYWDKSGNIKNQMRYWCDREIELKSESPWWNSVKDQNRT